MAIITKTVSAYRCEGCGYEWQPKRRGSKRKPKVCPICKTREWNVPKVPKTVSGGLSEAEGLR